MIMQNPKNMSEMIYCTVKPLPWRRKPNPRSCNIAFTYNWSVVSTHSNVDIVLKLYSKDLVFLDVGSIACSCQSLYCCWLLDFWCSMLDPDLNSSRWCMDIYDVIFFLRGGIRKFHLEEYISSSLDTSCIWKYCRFTSDAGPIDMKDTGNLREASALRDEVWTVILGWFEWDSNRAAYLFFL